MQANVDDLHSLDVSSPFVSRITECPCRLQATENASPHDDRLRFIYWVLRLHSGKRLSNGKDGSNRFARLRSSLGFLPV